MVDELVDRDRVLSLLKMIACRRRYAREREAKAAALRAEQQGKDALVTRSLRWLMQSR